MKKLFAGIAITAVLFAGVNSIAPTASALTIDEIQVQIKALLAQITDLTKQMNDLRAQQNPSQTTNGSMPMSHRICSILNRNISLGAQGDDVHGLQEFLSEQGYLSANATGYFGPLTARAVAQWQTSQGVTGVGAVGPMTRERIKIWCGNPSVPPVPPTCRPINYMPVLCSDGTAPQPKHDENGCIIGYECPIANFTPPASCKAWNDGCNECSRASADAPAMCTLRACFAAGNGYCSVYFDAATPTPPVACTMQYDPVCGQPPEPACRQSIPACMIATPGPQTYGNRCMLEAAGATLISAGACASTY